MNLGGKSKSGAEKLGQEAAGLDEGRKPRLQQGVALTMGKGLGCPEVP